MCKRWNEAIEYDFIYKDKFDYWVIGSKNHNLVDIINFCPFCGSELNDIGCTVVYEI